jgi:hypothetical protein
MKIKTIVAVALAICLSSSLALADTLIDVGAVGFGGGFVLDENGTPYWDNRSQDGGKANIGYYLTGDTTYYTGAGPAPFHPNPLNPALTNPQYLQLNTTTAGNNNFYFQKSTPANQISMLIEIAGWNPNNKFGWYDQTLANPTLNQIFPGSATPGNTYLLTLPVGVTKYGFYFQSNEGNTFYSEASRDSAGLTTLSHFAVFKGDNYKNTYFIGMEDQIQTLSGVAGGAEGKYGDFNDMAVRVTGVPLPGAVLLLGAGMARLAAYARRRRD